MPSPPAHPHFDAGGEKQAKKLPASVKKQIQGESSRFSGFAAAEIKKYSVSLKHDLRVVQQIFHGLNSACLLYTSDQAVLAGAGKLGQALVAYRGFDDYGLQIIAAFDNDETIVGRDIGETPIFPISKMTDLCPRLGVRTVSYTHLDVYKRQIPTRSRTAGWVSTLGRPHRSFSQKH